MERGDLALLLIDIGHDIRATRILLGRQALHEDQHKRDPSRLRRAGTAVSTAVRQLPMQ